MKISVAELVNVILEQMDDTTGKAPTEKAMRSRLIKQGYKRRDIDSAFKLINTHLAERPVLQEAMPSLRHLAFFESAKVQSDVLQAMTRLELMGLLEPYEREMLLERFIHSEGQADMEALDFALSYVIGTGRNAEAQQVMLNVFEGFSPTVH
ncbi:MAG TPA: DUF494 family protein [Candidatus Hydrogenedentes bacterium]|nr:DUF494 family protein [Candidatus Hydrogenedentota bacterium]